MEESAGPWSQFAEAGELVSVIETIIATTHLDLHYERFALSALEGLVDQVNSSYIPNGIEHDPRYPPTGRLLGAELVELPDGEHGVKATIELFDTAPSASVAGRAMPLHVREIERFQVHFDRTVAQHDAHGDVAALAALSGGPPVQMFKKALEPLAELMLKFGLFAIATIAAGVFQKIGADGWDAIKRRLVERYRERDHNEIFVSSFAVMGTRPIEVLVILADPSPEDITAYFEIGLERVDQLTADAVASDPDIAKIVIAWTAGTARLAYTVRWDAVPAFVDFALVPPLPAAFKSPGLSVQSGSAETEEE